MSMMHSEESPSSPWMLPSIFRPLGEIRGQARDAWYCARFRHGTGNYMCYLMHDVDGIYVVSWRAVGCTLRPLVYLLTVFLSLLGVI